MHAHTDVVTAIATPLDNSDMILTASRDKSIIIWDLTKEDETYDVPRHSLIGHSHFVQDVALSSNNQFAVSCSRDRELRLWTLDSGTTICRFVGHTKDVLSVDISKDNCQIVSGSRDGTIKLWNTFGECIYTFNDAHADWISCVLFSPNEFSPSDIQPYIVSASWDKTVKVWHQNDYDGNGDGKLIKTLAGHSGYVNTVAVSPDYSLWASGGKDGVILFRNVPDEKIVYSFYVGSIIHALCFFPNRYLLCAATESSIMILELVNKTIVEGLKIDLKTETDNSNSTEKAIYCTSLNWSADGSSLFGGYTDGVVRVWGFDSYEENLK